MPKFNILIAEKEFSKAAKKVLGAQGRVVDFTSKKVFLRNLPYAEVIITGLEVKLNKLTLSRASKLKVIGSRTTQLRHIDLKEAARRGIIVINIKGNSSVLKKISSTAEETIALLLALVRNIPWAFDSLKKERWERKKYGGHELAEKTIGLIGFGRLGKKMAKYAQAFDMKVIAYDPHVKKDVMRKHGVKKVGLEEVLKKADIVSLHAVYNDSTFGLIKESHFRLMKKNSVFLNTARGEITEEKALLKALKNGWISGAALDTLSGEVPDGRHLKNNPLVNYALQNENLIIVPHLGGATQEATEKTQVYIAKLVSNYLMKKNRHR